MNADERNSRGRLQSAPTAGIIALLLVPVLGCWFAALEAVQFNEGFGPQYSVTEPNFSYQGQFESLHKIDFKNFTLHTFDEHGKHLVCGKLSGGKWESIGKLEYNSLKLQKVFFLSGPDPASEFALVLFDEFFAGGSSNSSGNAQVWHLAGGRLQIVQQIEFDTHFGLEKRNYESFDQGKGRLVVRASHYLSGDAHCCISAYDEITFQWDGTRFALVRRVTHLTDYGKKEGKSLPATKATH